MSETPPLRRLMAAKEVLAVADEPTARIARLFDLVWLEPAVIRNLAMSMAKLEEIQDAKVQLAALPQVERRAGMVRRLEVLDQ